MPITSLPWLYTGDDFPPMSRVLGPTSSAPGLLAASTELTVEQLLSAYRKGIFPWYAEGEPVLWWSPDPRMVLVPTEFKVSVSLKKTLRRVLQAPDFEIRVDVDFPAVMTACRTAREQSTWITDHMIAAYSALAQLGYAHSVETWRAGKRVGGLYGVSMGAMFFGESMFTHCSDASKIALAALVGHLRQYQVKMIDCQQNTSHLASLGAREIPRSVFLAHLRCAIGMTPIPWDFDKSVLTEVVR